MIVIKMILKIEVKKRHILTMFLLLLVSVVIGYGTTNPAQFGHSATETDVTLSNGSVMNLQRWTETSGTGPKANEFVKSNNLVQTNSRTFVDLPGTTITTATGNTRVFISAVIGGVINSEISTGRVDLQLVVDGVQKDFQTEKIGGTTKEAISVSLMSFETLSAGTHTIKVQYRADPDKGGMAQVSTNGEQRSLAVMER